MTQFHKGQDVEVRSWRSDDARRKDWFKAKIVAVPEDRDWARGYEVQFPDNSRAVFEEGHIRAVFDPGKLIEGGGDL
jgi:hypothetical protein